MEKISIIGPVNAGKTTFLHRLLQLNQPTQTPSQPTQTTTALECEVYIGNITINEVKRHFQIWDVSACAPGLFHGLTVNNILQFDGYIVLFRPQDSMQVILDILSTIPDNSNIALICNTNYLHNINISLFSDYNIKFFGCMSCLNSPLNIIQIPIRNLLS